jgi:succinoglycan biosynthesis transport protein ExoP
MFAGDIFAALRDRWKLAALIAALIFVNVAVWIGTQPRIYQATSSLLFDVSQPDPSVDTEQRGGVSNASLVATQIDVIASNFVASRVAERLAAEAGQPAPASDALMRTGRGLLSQVQVTTGKSSNLLNIMVRDRDPQRAAHVANLFARSFLEKQRDLREIAASGYARWLDERTREVRGRLTQAQSRLANYQRANGLIGVDRLDLEADRLRSLNSELASSEGDAVKARSSAGSPGGPDVEFSGLVQQLRGSAAAQEARVAEISRTLGPNHPDLIAARAQLAATLGQLALAQGTASRALSAGSAAARNREADLRERLQAQQGRMLSLSHSQDDLAILRQDVEAARQTYDEVRKRFGDVVLRSQATQTNATQLDRALTPGSPSSPNVPLLMVLGFLMSVGIGVSVVFVFELLEPRVRTEAGVLDATGHEVVAEYGGRQKRGFRQLLRAS